MAGNNPVSQTDHLSKVYKGKTRALNNLTLAVQPGEVFGYLGPNGAGKTTTIRILLDIIRPTSGRATIFGLDARADHVALHRRIGFMPGELNLWNQLTGLEVVHYVSRVRGALDMPYVKQIAERLEFDLSKRVRDYSSGNRRKLGIILAFMHRPELLILDEPTTGLDPLMQQEFHGLVREAHEAGHTIFLSSHVLSEVQALCDRVGILREGELKAVERVDAITHTNFRWVTLIFRTAVAPESLKGVPGVDAVSAGQNGNGPFVRLRLTGELGPLLRVLNVENIVDIYTEKPTLEEIFLTFYSADKEAAQ
jgi:ABC-2 type transport system ATP-binding protein